MRREGDALCLYILALRLDVLTHTPQFLTDETHLVNAFAMLTLGARVGAVLCGLNRRQAFAHLRG